MNDGYAARWLDRALEDAEREVEQIQGDLKNKKFWVHTAEGHLEQAVVKVDAIRLIISRSSLSAEDKRQPVTE